MLDIITIVNIVERLYIQSNVNIPQQTIRLKCIRISIITYNNIFYLNSNNASSKILTLKIKSCPTTILTGNALKRFLNTSWSS